MLTILTLQKATAAGTLPFVVPASGEIVGIQSTVQAWISSDPSLANTELSTPTADGTKNNILAIAFGNNLQRFDIGNAPQVSAGETLYFSAGGKGTCVLYIVGP